MPDVRKSAEVYTFKPPHTAWRAVLGAVRSEIVVTQARREISPDRIFPDQWTFYGYPVDKNGKRKRLSMVRRRRVEQKTGDNLIKLVNQKRSTQHVQTGR